MWFNITTSEKLPYYVTQFKNEWWDNSTLPIWITAQNDLRCTFILNHSCIFFTLIQIKCYVNANSLGSHLNVCMDLDFVSLYFVEPDGTGHKYGPDSPERREMVKQVDRTVGYIRSLAEQNGLADSLNIIITADHGMSNVYRMLDKVYNALKGAHPHLHVFKKEEMPKRLYFANNNCILPIILFSDPGYVINGVVQFNVGEHGFDNEEMDMNPIFRAVGPAFQKNLEVGPFETVNIYPLMCHILGIKPDPNDGHLDATKHMLVSDIKSNIFVGLAAVAGFLVVFIVVVWFNVFKKEKNDRRYEGMHV
uniref:Ectonucleotide pyrophosphatase/phosphodiesterase 7 n=1 Tax=Oncorhynchus kisutch TaxID=8019 RepID=A0A8C7CN35_ONCKI